MFPQNLSVSGSFPVAGREHGAFGLSHVAQLPELGYLM